MAQFMLVLMTDTQHKESLSPEEMQAVIAEYSAWAARMGAEGRLVGGSKLTDDGGFELQRDGDGVRVVDGPYSETKEVLGGFFVLEARDYEEAVELARSCPHLVHHPRLVVRQVHLTAAAADA
jgi:hypothetical protein